MAADSAAVREKGTVGQYVTFAIEGEKFGIEVMRVQEVLGKIEPRVVPRAMPFMKGVIDLRNIIVPVVDLRLKFGLAVREYDRDTAVIITDVRGVLVGLVVDSVSDVISIDSLAIQDTPHFSIDIRTDAVEGICKFDEKIIIILNADRIFDEGELAGMDSYVSA